MSSTAPKLPLAVMLTFAACACALLGTLASIAFVLDDLQAGKAAVERAGTLVDDIRQVRLFALEAEFSRERYLRSGNAEDLARARLDYKRLSALLEGLAQRLASDQVRASEVDVLREIARQRIAGLDAPAPTTVPAPVPNNERERGNAGPDDARTSPAERTAIERIRATTGALLRDAGQDLADAGQGSWRSSRWALVAAMAATLIAAVALLLLYSVARRHFSLWIAAAERQQCEAGALEAGAAARTRQLTQLARHLIRSADNEKARLARELHDELGSNVTAVTLDVAAVELKLKASDPALAMRLRRALDALRSVVALSRRVIEDLRPSALDNMELADALRGHCEDFAERTGVRCDADLGTDVGKVDPDWSIALFSVARESLANAARYASPTSIRLSLQREAEGIRLKIADDGIGLPADALDQAMAHGLLGMRERLSMLGGSFDIRRGDEGLGTVVEAFVPFTQPGREQHATLAG